MNTPTKTNPLKRQAPSSPAAYTTPDTTPIKKGAKVSEVPMAPLRENKYLAPRAGFLDNADATGYVSDDE
jgi:hypothetical protein